jgi:hypothetical protein
VTEFSNVGSPGDHEPSPIVEISWREAEQRLSRRVDRRMRYATDGADLLVLCRYTTACSGCTEVGEYERMPDAGAGCSECGYTGKRRQSVWTPLALFEAARRLRKGNGS